MSLIAKLREKQSKENKITSTSIKIPQDMDEIIADLAIILDATKQDIIIDLLKDAINLYQKEQQDLAEVEQEFTEQKNISTIINQTDASHFFLLNTNKRQSIDDHNFMVDNGYAAAYEDGWKELIEKINKGDVVFLYANGKGIVGYGRASGEVLRIQNDKCFYQKLDNYQLLDEPLKAKDIRDICNRTPVFLKTLSLINNEDGLIIYNKINEK